MTDAERLLDGLRRQRDRYREMGAVAAEQRRALEASDMDGLLAVVERKRALLAEIAGLEKDVAPLRARWDELKPALAGDLEEVVASTRELLQALLKQEDEGRAALERQRQASADLLKARMQMTRARTAYKP